VLGLVADTALARPTAGAMAEAGETAPRHLGSGDTALQLLLPRFGTMFKDTVGGEAESILDGKELAERIEHGQGTPASPRSLIFTPGNAASSRGTKRREHGRDTGMTRGVSRTQPRCQQASAVGLEDQHGVIHVLAAGSVEEAELLLAVGRIVGGIEVEQKFRGASGLDRRRGG